MKTKIFALFSICLILTPPTFAQEKEEMDEVIARGTHNRTDPAMSAYLAGDFETAAVEFKANAFCALRASRNFTSSVESARDSTLRFDNNIGGDTSAQPTGGPGGGPVTIQTAPSATPSPTLNSSNFDNSETTDKRSCRDRGFQLYMAGLSQIKLGQFDEAKESLKTATFIRTSIYDAHFRLALLEYQDGNIKKAKKELKKLSKLEAKCRDCDSKKEMQEQVAYLKNILQ